MEIWKTIEYANKYEVSNLGNIRTKKTNKLRSLNIERLRKDNKRVRPGLINNEGKNKAYYLHRIVAEHFIENSTNLPEVNHIDGDCYNNKVDNLEWISKIDNMKHANENKLINRYKRRVIITHKVTGEEKVFDKLTDCAEFVECHPGKISSICCGKRCDKIWDMKYGTKEKQEEINDNTIWKEYPECGKYLISNTGDIKNKKTNRIMMGSKVNGYRFMTLFIDKDTPKLNRLLHRMVAQTFLPNPLNLPVVNHKDTNILNNNVDNLEWVTYEENMNTEETKKNLRIGKNSKIIHQVEIETGEIIGTFDGATNSQDKLKICKETILKICHFYNKGHTKTSLKNGQKTYKKKYIFIFDEDKDKINEFLEVSRIDNRKTKKPIFQINKDTNEIVNTFESCYEASKKLNMCYTTICNICRYYTYIDEDRPISLKYYHSNKGFIYKYYE